jgi:hypothetical protein
MEAEKKFMQAYWTYALVFGLNSIATAIAMNVASQVTISYPNLNSFAIFAIASLILFMVPIFSTDRLSQAENNMENPHLNVTKLQIVAAVGIAISGALFYFEPSYLLALPGIIFLVQIGITQLVSRNKEIWPKRNFRNVLMSAAIWVPLVFIALSFIYGTYLYTQGVALAIVLLNLLALNLSRNS